MNQFLKRFLQGLLLGFAFVSTISGGTMAVILGVYDELIGAVNTFLRSPKKSLGILIPYALGGVISILIFIIPIIWLLKKFPFPATAFFAGLTLGGLGVFNSMLKGKFNWKNLLFAVGGFLLVFAIGAFSFFSNLETSLDIITPMQIIVLFFLGIILMAASVAPGISGTFILIALGYYTGFFELVKRVILFDFINVGMDLGGFFAAVVGVLIGLFAVSKLFELAFTKSRDATNFTVLGFIIGSIVVAFFNGKMKVEYASFNIWTALISVVTLVAGVLISTLIFYLAARKANVEPLEVEGNNDGNGLGI